MAAQELIWRMVGVENAWWTDSKEGGNTFNIEYYKNEILKLQRAVNEKGYAIIPTKMYFKDHLVKVEIALAKGKKLYDKRETIKKRQQDREISRELKNY